MEHVHDLAAVRLNGSALTIGSFDGVHRGHQDLLGRMLAGARGLGLPAVVLTFFPHPSVVLRGRKPAYYITSPEERADLLERLGVDLVITQTFDLELSRVEAPDFLDRLTAHLGFQDLWAGEDFALGHERRGSRHYLSEVSSERGFRFHVVPPFLLEGEVVSSTRVREALRSGDVARAANYLGRHFELPGRVVQGVGRGKRLGIPTANLEIWEERAVPGNGVYACFAELEGNRKPAVVNIGVRPTFADNLPAAVVEAHLLDFEGDLYERELKLIFVDRLRDERRFSGPEALIEQIVRDIERARDLLGRVELA
ncbi:MAG TPA: bifunctional riboflavin kinase/FAD synthetase [Anaerolineales bacterium]